jgi:hypothetical protein
MLCPDSTTIRPLCFKFSRVPPDFLGPTPPPVNRDPAKKQQPMGQYSRGK